MTITPTNQMGVNPAALPIAAPRPSPTAPPPSAATPECVIPPNIPANRRQGPTRRIRRIEKFTLPVTAALASRLVIVTVAVVEFPPLPGGTTVKAAAVFRLNPKIHGLWFVEGT